MTHHLFSSRYDSTHFDLNIIENSSYMQSLLWLIIYESLFIVWIGFGHGSLLFYRLSGAARRLIFLAKFFCLYELGPFPSSFRKIESSYQKPTHFSQNNWIFCQNELEPFPSSFRDWPVVLLLVAWYSFCSSF